MQPPRGALRRLYWIDASLQRDECPTAQHLARQLGVSRHTIQRDIARLSSSYKAPVLYDAALGGFRYGHPFVPPLPDLRPADALELGKALAGKGPLAGTAFEAMTRRLFEPLAGLLRSPADGKSGQEGPEARTAGAQPRTGSRASHPASGPLPSRLGERVRPGCERMEEPVVVRIRFDATAARSLLSGRFLRREQVQFLTDGGMEATVQTHDPDALLLDLLRWAPHFDIAVPAWVRRRLQTLLRSLLRHWEAPRKRAPSRKATKPPEGARKRASRERSRQAGLEGVS